jgi:fibronectin-binding autotransporter adhesin
MSFSAGTFSINSSGQPVVSGTTISSSVFNALTADLATGLSTCMLKDGTQTATAGIGFFAGTVGLPGIYFGTDTATGLYRIGLNNTGYSINGTKLLDLSAALFAVTGAATVSTTLGVTGATTLTGGLVLPGTAANITLGSNYISNGGTDAGLSFDASNDATLSGRLGVTLAINGAASTNTFGSATNISGAPVGLVVATTIGDGLHAFPLTTGVNGNKSSTLRLWGDTSASNANRFVEIASERGSGTDVNSMVFSVGNVGTLLEAMRISSTGAVTMASTLGLASYIQGTEEAAPAAPSANGYRIFAQDNGGGKTQLMVIFSSGAAQQLAIQP